MLKKDFIIYTVSKLVSKKLFLNSEVKFKDQNGNFYKCGTVTKVLSDLGIKVEPIDDLPPGNYALLDIKSGKPISPNIFKFYKLTTKELYKDEVA